MENYRQLVAKSIACADLHILCILYDGLKDRFSAEEAASLRQEIQSAFSQIAKQKNIPHQEGDNIRVLEQRNKETNELDVSPLRKREKKRANTAPILHVFTNKCSSHLASSQDDLVMTQDWRLLITNNQINELYTLFTAEESLLQEILSFLVEQEDMHKIIVLLRIAEQNNNFDFVHHLLQAILTSKKLSFLQKVWIQLPNNFELRTSDLLVAAQSQNTEIMEFLLEEGELNPLVGSDWSELEPLLDLIFNFSTQAVEKLLFHLRDSEYYEQIYSHIYRELV